MILHVYNIYFHLHLIFRYVLWCSYIMLLKTCFDINRCLGDKSFIYNIITCSYKTLRYKLKKININNWDLKCLVGMYAHAHMRTGTYTNVHTCICTHVTHAHVTHAHVTHAHATHAHATHAHATHAHATHAHTFAHAYMYTRTCTHTRMCTCAHTHTLISQLYYRNKHQITVSHGTGWSHHNLC